MKEKKDSRENFFVLKPLTHKQLAELYGVSWLTFQKWIKKVEQEVGRKTGHFYHIHQVRIIFKIFGIPKQISISMDNVEDMF